MAQVYIPKKTTSGGIQPVGGTFTNITGQSLGVQNATIPNLTVGVINATTGYELNGVPFTGGGVTIDGDTNSASSVGGVLNLTSSSGKSVSFQGDGVQTIQLKVTDSNFNTNIGQSSGGTGGSGSTSLGYESLTTNTGNANTAIGSHAMNINTSSAYSTAVGADALHFGCGNTNIAIGNEAGYNYSNANGETNNILVGHLGVAHDSGVIRIGHIGPQTSCYIAGINNVDLSTTTLVTESGSQLGTANLTSNAGSSVSFTTSSGAINLNVTDSNSNTIVGGGNSSISGTNNVGLGANSLHSLTSASNNVAVGTNALQSMTDTGGYGGSNTAVGSGSQQYSNSRLNTSIGNNSMSSNNPTAYGNACVAIGDSTMLYASGGNCVSIGQGSGQAMAGNCTAVGASSGYRCGSNTICLGYQAGSNYNTSGENNDICIGSNGVSGESNTTRIGTHGTQTSVFVAGIDGVNVGSTAKIVTESADQLGTATLTAGSNITITPSANTITISASGGGNPLTTTLTGFASTTGTISSSDTILSGIEKLYGGSTNIDGVNVGSVANVVVEHAGQMGTALITGGNGISISAGSNSIAIQNSTPQFNAVLGTNNVSGPLSSYSMTSGSNNDTLLGYSSGANLSTGSHNTLLGYNAGQTYTTEGGNICINNTGTAFDNGVTRIGSSISSAAYIYGIDNVNVGSTTTNLVTEHGNQLGTATLAAGYGISIAPSANTITIANTVSGGAVTFNTNVGSATELGGTLSIIAGSRCGKTVTTSGSGSAVSLNLGDTNSNICLGTGSAPSLTGGSNTALGTSSLVSTTSGSSNIGIGPYAGAFLAGSSSNNIMIGSEGTSGDSGVIRIGTSGTQNSCYITGIDGVNVGSTANIVTESGNQLGTATLTAGSNITITPSANTITISASGGANPLTTSLTGYTPSFGSISNTDTVLSGFEKLGGVLYTDSSSNSIFGNTFFSATNTGQLNTGVGETTLNSNTSGNNNSAVGMQSLYYNTTGSNNCGFGRNSLLANTTGSNNCGLGYLAGSNYTTESNNICINNSGVVGESFALRLGNSVTVLDTGVTSVGSGAGNVGFGNSFLGQASGSAVTTSAQNNTLVGSFNAPALTTGGYNTVCGGTSASSLITGTSNTLIGYNADVTTGSNSNAIALGYGAKASGSNVCQIGNSSLATINTSASLTCASVNYTPNSSTDWNTIYGAVPTTLNQALDMAINPNLGVVTTVGGTWSAGVVNSTSLNVKFVNQGTTFVVSLPPAFGTGAGGIGYAQWSGSVPTILTNNIVSNYATILIQDITTGIISNAVMSCFASTGMRINLPNGASWSTNQYVILSPATFHFGL